MKHIRNAIAHAYVKAINKPNFSIDDYSEQGSLSAIGRMNCTIFYRLIDKLLKTKKDGFLIIVYLCIQNMIMDEKTIKKYCGGVSDFGMQIVPNGGSDASLGNLLSFR